MEEKTLHIVIVGHIDHGKSTLVGRLFYDTGCLPPDKVEELRRISAEMGKELEFAYMMDHLEEERQKGITIDIAHTFFATPKRRYVIIDAPGHKEFLKNMITGSSQAQAALLLVDISQGIKEQTRRHCYILGLLGIKQVAVLVNKMDMVDYSQERFNTIKAEIESVLGKLNIKPAYILPIAARLGDNIAKKSEKLPWFKGPTVLEALDSFSTNEAEKTRLRFPVQDVYDVDGKKTAVGRVESGVLRKAQDVHILPDGTRGRITEIKQFLRDGMAQASVGECIGVTTDGSALKRGQILVDEVSSTITDTIRANIFWLIDKDYKLGISLTWKCATQEAKGKIEKIHKRFDPASIEVVEEGAKEIRPAEIAEVEIKLDRLVVIDKFSEIPEMGRFVLEHMGHPVAGGIII
jgi:sulfate adenylyltransferase subunit 1